MLWNICFIIAILILVGGIVFAVRAKAKETRSFFVLAIAVFLSAMTMFFALEYTNQYAAEPNGAVNAFFIAAHDTIGIFVVNTEFAFLKDNMQGMQGWLVPLCSTLMAIYFICAPVFTFGFLLSFFKNLRSRLLFSLKRSADVYVFSELNEKSLVLAKDIKKNNPRRVIVFCDVFENDDERFGELLADAKKIHAIFFQKDILDINFKRHTKHGSLYFFITGQDNTENINQSLGLAKRYGQFDTTQLYLFSDSISGEMLLFSGKKNKMKIHRVNESLAMIHNALYQDPTVVFKNTSATTPEGEKVISAVLVGLGGYGMESLKTLLWYGQMEGYRLRIDAFDQGKDAAERVAYLCPEVMSEQYNHKFVPGEAYYSVNVHSDVSVGTDKFAREIAKLTAASFVLVSLGDDDLNIETAVSLRTMFARMGITPTIYAVVYNDQLASCLEALTNYRDQAYNIRTIGGLESSYCEKVILHSELEQDALAIHTVGYGGSEEDFFAHEYNYHSSTASALHNRARACLRIHGADLPPEERTEEQNERLMDLEHRRWNAYMRSIGYVYSGSKEKSSRNDLGKMHNNLVVFDDLTDAEKKLDLGVANVRIES